MGTCHQAQYFLPLALCVATAERNEVVCPFLAALLQEFGKHDMQCAPTKRMGDHAHAFGDKLIAEFSSMQVADCSFQIGNKVPKKFGQCIRDPFLFGL